MDEQKLIETIKSFPKFAESFLSIRTKSGSIKPFKLNRAQLYLHERLEAQRKATGKVRAIILKGRQQGCSTYVQGRDFHKIITRKGTKAYILTHEAEATKNLFNMTKMFYDSIADEIPSFLPSPDKSSSKELNFKSLRSGYSVGTAGNKGAGRSSTVQIFHGSEVAFWPNAEEHAKGVMQAVSNEPGTEIILESTANGIGNYYYNMWQAACDGQSEFQAIFIPWYWQPEYTINDNEEIALLEDEEELLAQYSDNGLTIPHLKWRRKKIYEFSADYDAGIEKFQVEYPMSANEAFLNPVEDRFIDSKIVNKLRRNEVDSDSPLIIGVDPAIKDLDSTAIIRRNGRKIHGLERKYKLNTMEIVGLVKTIIDKEKPVKVAIDCIGIGAGIVDRLHEMGYQNVVEGVNVARKASDSEKFVNQRAELWHTMREFLYQEMPVQIPNDDSLIGDLTSCGYKFKSGGRLQLESKDELRKRGMKSPDAADALALTFVLGEMLINNSYNINYLPPSDAGLLY